jgi:inhibitor of KinA
LAEVDEQIAVARKEKPRTLVPAGSVGIAGVQTGIYPMNSPGGWQLIGRTPFSLFNKNDNPPVQLAPGDRVNFYAITKDEFDSFTVKGL